MSAVTSIEWTDVTWNPVRGCALVSEGCRNCYAMKQAHRFSAPGKPYAGLTELGPSGPRWTGRARAVPTMLEEPLRWRTPRRVFVNSMSDLFHEDVPAEFVLQVFDVMERASWHTFQILTKRPERMLDILGGSSGAGLSAPPLPNVWLGISAENQKAADERIPILADVPAAVRFVSAEPLLGPIDFDAVPMPGFAWFALIDWVIFGGESGAKPRPCAMEWIERGVAQCKAAGVAAFVKQLGAYVVSEHRAAADEAEMHDVLGPQATWPEHRWFWRAGLGADRKGADLATIAPELNVREFPATASA